MGIAIITGASSGMGRELLLASDKERQFDEIWAVARREDKLKELVGKTRAKVRPIALDLTKTEDIEKLGAMLDEEKPAVSLLANCAGYGKFGSYRSVTLCDAMGMIDLNCKALVAVTYKTLPYIENGGYILHLDSLSSFQPVPRICTYGATKAFVLSFSRALNVELKDRNIKSMAVCPGWVRTEFFDRAKTEESDAVTYFNKIYEAEDVVKTAIHDLYHTKKDVSIHGLGVKLQVLGVKLLPHKIVMKIWEDQQSGKNQSKDNPMKK